MAKHLKSDDPNEEFEISEDGKHWFKRKGRRSFYVTPHVDPSGKVWELMTRATPSKIKRT